jgi:hypothetical protein
MRYHLENEPIEGNQGFPLTPILIIKNNGKYLCVFFRNNSVKGRVLKGTVGSLKN